MSNRHFPGLCCDGVRRRDFLTAGVLGGVSFLGGGLSLGQSLAMAAEGAAPKKAIFVNLAGGPSHLDSFDPKPDAPDTHRGEFGTIATAVPGVAISDQLPQMARSLDKLTLIRGVSHSLAAHQLGTDYVNTGNRPLPSLEFPGYSAVYSEKFGGPVDLPTSVAVPRSQQRPGYLGVEYAPMSTTTTPKSGKPYGVRGVSLGPGMTVADVTRRSDLLRRVDTAFGQFAQQDALLSGLDRFSQQAYSVITSDRTRTAFDVSKESPTVQSRFDDNPFSQSCLLATRLVEHGVPFVTVQFGGWDTHNDGFAKLKTQQLPPLDNGLSAMLETLSEKGLLAETVVFVTGEFGRTPKINAQRVGRDHYPRAMFMLMAGGGIPGGQIIGQTDPLGAGPVGDGYSPDDVAASFYTRLGIDPRDEYQTPTGRPVMIVRDGTPIPELVS